MNADLDYGTRGSHEILQLVAETPNNGWTVRQTNTMLGNATAT